jgi:hypothetical protein
MDDKAGVCNGNDERSKIGKVTPRSAMKYPHFLNAKTD